MDFSLDSVPSIYKALEAFEADLLQSFVKPNHILMGDSVGSLPPKTKNYVVNTILWQQQNGTGSESFNHKTGRVNIDRYYRVTVQIDCYASDSEIARKMATALSSVANTQFATEYLNAFGVVIHYGEMPKNTTIQGEDTQPLCRWTVTFDMGYWQKMSIATQGIDSIVIDKIINVGLLDQDKG